VSSVCNESAIKHEGLSRREQLIETKLTEELVGLSRNWYMILQLELLHGLLNSHFDRKFIPYYTVKSCEFGTVQVRHHKQAREHFIG
jgi:hypothetical protein